MVAPFRFALGASLLVALSACDDLKDYQGHFDGRIVDGNFVRSCFPAKTKATLEFKPDRAVGPVDEGSAGELSTLTTSDGTFHDTPLIPPSALPHDALSELTFPGPRRLRNYVLMARPEEGPLAGRDATVVVSLLRDGRIEVRVMARTEETTEPCPDEGDDASTNGAARVREYFGVFRLN